MNPAVAVAVAVNLNDIDNQRTSDSNHHEFIDILLKDTTAHNTNNLFELQNCSQETMLNKNLKSTYKWVQILNHKEYQRASNFKIIQAILYDRCLKYHELKVISQKLNEKEYNVLLTEETDQVNQYKITYNMLFGKMTQFAEFIVKYQHLINSMDLLLKEDYIKLVKLFYSYRKSSVTLTPSMEELGSALTQNTDKADSFNRVLMSLTITLKEDYGPFSVELDRIRRILSSDFKAKQAFDLVGYLGFRENLSISKGILITAIMGVITAILSVILSSSHK